MNAMRKRVSCCASAVAVGMVCGLFAASPAGAGRDAESWSAQETLTAPGVIARMPQLVAHENGAMTAGWTGTTGDVFDPRGLVIRSKPVAGGWGPEQLVDPEARRGLDLALDGDGRLVAAYSAQDAESAFAVTQGSGGEFEDPVRLAPQLAGFVVEGGGPFLSVAPSGEQHVVWLQRVDGKGRRMLAVHRDGSDVPWSKPTVVAGAAARPLSLTVDDAADGSVAAMWRVGRPVRLRMRVLSATGQWSPLEQVARPDLAIDPQVANRGQGRITALWVGRTQSLLHRAYTAVRTGSGRWSHPMRVDQRVRDELWHSLTTDGKVTAVVWSSLTADRTELMVRVQTGRRWGEPSALTGRRHRIGMNGAAFHTDGSLRVVWSQDNRAMTRIRGPRGLWGPRAHIPGPSPSGDTPPVIATFGERMAGVVLSEPTGGVRYTERIG
jgi:hypothetical protein